MSTVSRHHGRRTGEQAMRKGRFGTEEIIYKLLEAEVLLVQWKKTSEVRQNLRNTDQAYYRCRKDYVSPEVYQTWWLAHLAGKGQRPVQEVLSRSRAEQDHSQRCCVDDG